MRKALRGRGSPAGRLSGDPGGDAAASGCLGE